jgi:hypothetical protein
MDDVTLFPIVGWKTEGMPAGYGALNIQALPGIPAPGLSQAEMDQATQSIQFGISAEQCEMLAQDLMQMAARLRAKRKSAN